MYHARSSSRSRRFAAVLVLLAVSGAGATLLGCSGEPGTDQQTGASTSLPGQDEGGVAKGGTPSVGAPTNGHDASSSSPTGTAAPVTDAGAAPGQDSGATTGTGKDLGEACTQNSDCKSAECFVGGMQSYCSLRCTTANAATVCVAPFAGVCNNHGYCKK